MIELRNKNILIYLQDVGSSNYLIDAINGFNFNNNKLFFILNDNVKNLESNIRKKKYSKNLSIIVIKRKKKFFFEKYIYKNQINFCIATCAQRKIDNSNYFLIKSALERKINVVTFLDQWKGYDRFKFFIKNKKFLHIGVIDNNQKKHLKNTFNFLNITVTGHPSLEKLKTTMKKNDESILIVSEPLVNNKFKSIFFKNKIYTNKLLSFVNQYNYKHTNKKIYYRKHPKENSNKELYTLQNIIKIDNLNENNSLKKFKYFIGFDTIFLAKAMLTGGKVLKLKHINDLNPINFNLKINKLNNAKLNKLKKNIISSKLRCHEFLNNVFNSI